ncbi:MAG: PEP-CTERM sorting domain-containing protein [Myxococcota bacterium]
MASISCGFLLASTLLAASGASAQERAIYRLDLSADISATATGSGGGSAIPDGFLVLDHDGAGNVSLQLGSWVSGDIDQTFGSGETTNDAFAVAIAGASGTLTGSFASGSIAWSSDAYVYRNFGTRTCTQAADGQRCSTDPDMGASGSGTHVILQPGALNNTPSGPVGGLPLSNPVTLPAMTLSGTSLTASAASFVNLGAGVNTTLTIEASRIDNPAAEKVIIDINPETSTEIITGTPVINTTPLDGFVTLEFDGSDVTVLGSSWFESENWLDWGPTPLGPGNFNGRFSMFQIAGGAGTLTGTSSSGSIIWDVFTPSTLDLEVSGKTCTQAVDTGICSSDPDFFLVLGSPVAAGENVARADMIDFLDFTLGDTTLAGTSASAANFGFNDDGIAGNGVFNNQFNGEVVAVPEPGTIAGLFAGLLGLGALNRKRAVSGGRS